MEQIYFVLTEQCNLSCNHCIRDSSPYRTETGEREIVERTLFEIRNSFPDALVLLSGGEPTIHRDFREILKYSLDLGLEVTINSNGATSFFTIDSLRPWANYSNLSVQISLDGTEETHDRIRGAGSFKRSLKAIGILRSLGIACSVSSTVIDLRFFDHIEPFLAPLDNLGLAHIAIKRATYAGRASSGMEVSTEGWNSKVYALRQQQWQTRILAFPMYDFRRLDNIDDEVLAELQLPDSAINCGAGTAKVYIYPNGDVCSCTCFKDHPMGNLYQQPLGVIFQKNLRIEVLDSTCQSCRYFHLCRGGCLGSGYQYSGRLGQPDPRCPKLETSDLSLIEVTRV